MRVTQGKIISWTAVIVLLALAAILLFGCSDVPESSQPKSAERTAHDSLYPAPLKPTVRGTVFRGAGDGLTSLVEEGVMMRLRWLLSFTPDSQRLTVTDSISGASYANMKVNRTHRTAKFSAPVDRYIKVRLQVYQGGTRRFDASRSYLTGEGDLIPPPDSVPGDTIAPPPPDTVVTPPPPPPGSDTLLTERVDITLQACQRQYVIGSNLQVALDTVKRGDCMRLPANAIYTGNFRLRAKPGTDWIQIYSYAAFPDDGIRFRPTQYPNVATIRSRSVEPALRTDSAPDASYYRIMGVKFDVDTSVTMAYSIVAFRNSAATSVGQLPHHIILDRVWVQGHDKLNTQRCVEMNVPHGAVINSWLEGCHHTDSDAQAIISWYSPGPMAFNNNYLEGSHENIMIGGADPRILNLVPSNIETCRNHINKPIIWQTIATHPNGKKWVVKNNIETKNVRQWHICQNVVTNNWLSGQTGFMLVMKSSNDGGRCRWCVAERVLIEENYFYNTPAFANFKALDDYRAGQVVGTDTLGGGIGMNRIVVRNNYVDKVGGTVSGDRRIYQLLGHATDTTKTLRDIIIEGNAVNGWPNNYVMFDGGPTIRLTMRNNVGFHGAYGVFGSGKGVGAAAWNFFTQNSTASGNILVTRPGDNLGTYPAGWTLTGTWPQNVAGAVDTVALKQKLAGVVVPR